MAIQDGVPRGWDLNFYGQLGDGRGGVRNTHSKVPVAVLAGTPSSRWAPAATFTAAG